MSVRKIKKSWWVDIKVDYIRYRKRSPENSRTGALAYEAVLRGKLAQGEVIKAPESTALKDQLFWEFAEIWFRDYVKVNNKYSEQKAKRYMLSASLIPFFGKTFVGKISLQQIEQFKAKQIKAGLSSKTINNQLTVLNKCLVIAYDWLELLGSPPRIKKLKCPPAKTDYLSQEESNLLLAKASGMFREMLLVTLRTGLRQGELKGLQWEEINWQNRTLNVNYSWNDDMKVLESPKSNRSRVIPLNVEVFEALYKRKKGHGFVFLTPQGTPYTEQILNPALAKVCMKAGLRIITWHKLRHTFATHLTMRGVAPGTVQVLLGHASIATTMRYAHVPSSSLREAVDVLGPQLTPYKNLGQPEGNLALKPLWAAEAVEAQTL